MVVSWDWVGVERLERSPHRSFWHVSARVIFSENVPPGSGTCDH